MLLAIETSCDETAVAILDAKKYCDSDFLKADDVLVAELVLSQIKMHAEYGGVVPELASREHEKNLTKLVSRALTEAGLNATDVSTVAVTQGPGLKGCLLVGLMFAKGFAFRQKCALVPVNHLHGHVAAAELNFGPSAISSPSLIVLVSGGHTQILLSEKLCSFEVLAETRDDAAGEAFDKTASLMGLPYPGGPEISKLAAKGDSNRFKFPIGMKKDPSQFSFSGFKTAVQREIAALEQQKEPMDKHVADLAASVEESIAQTVLNKLSAAVNSHSECRSIILTGGVAANDTLSSTLESLAIEKGLNFFRVPPKWCTDNASMIGAAACQTISTQFGSYESFLADYRADSTKQRKALEAAALPRFPLV